MLLRAPQAKRLRGANGQESPKSNIPTAISDRLRCVSHDISGIVTCGGDHHRFENI